MGICTKRHFLLTVCLLQVIATVERQVFEFLGFMWVPILANFFQLIFVIFGFFGAFQYRPKYIITYTVWSIFWIGWNVFVMCFYLNVGVLNKDSDMLNMGTGSVSWWEVNGAGCKPVYPTNITLENDPFRPIRPERVLGCVLDYQYVEVIHAAIQCLLSALGSAGGIFLTHLFMEEDDSSRAKSRTTSLYSIEYSPHQDRSSTPDVLEDEGTTVGAVTSPFSRPMTPRRVKRRSISRGSTRNSSRFRSSNRSVRSNHVNPVARLIDGLDSSTSNDSGRFRAKPQIMNNLSTANLLPTSPLANAGGHLKGHSNPLYQSSRPNSTHSLDLENRPSSARSSYSNYHGQRPTSIHADNLNSGHISGYSGQATGQVPVGGLHRNSHRRSSGHHTSHSNSVGSYGFSGPVHSVYLQGLDSETVI